MNKKTTNKQDLFAKHYSLGKSGKDAAILAGYSARSAEVIASENLRKPEVLKRIESIFDKAGLSDETLAERLQKAIDAGLGQRASNADTIKGLKMAYELKNMFPRPIKETQVDILTSTLTLNLQEKSIEEIEAFVQDITIRTQSYLVKLKEKNIVNE